MEETGPSRVLGLDHEDAVLHLLVVESRRQNEDARLRVEREDVVAPVGEDRVRHLGVDPFVQVAGHHRTDEGPSPRVYRDVERIARLEAEKGVVCEG